MRYYLAAIWRTISSFMQNEKANVSMTFGVAAFALMALTGVAIDYARAHLVKKEISRALDAAVLRVGVAAVLG